MGTFIGEHPEAVIAFVGILVTVVGFFMKAFFERINKLEKEDAKLRAEQDLMRANYLGRFEDVKKHQTEEGKETREMLSDIQVAIAKVIAAQISQKEFCAYVQKSKEY